MVPFISPTKNILQIMFADLMIIVVDMVFVTIQKSVNVRIIGKANQIAQVIIPKYFVYKQTKVE